MKYKNEIGAIYSFESKSQIERPLFAAGVSAGNPSPADDYIEQQLNLNTHLVRHPKDTYFAKICGESMKDAGIYDQDILIIDRALSAMEGKIVLVVIDNEFRVRRLAKDEAGWLLRAENKDYPSISGTEKKPEVWGVVTNAIHRL